MKATKPLAPYRYCWECGRQLYGGGRFYRKVQPIDGDQPVVYVHGDCATRMIAAQEAVAVS